MGAEMIEGFEQDCACPRPVAMKVFEDDCACPKPITDAGRTGGKPVTEKMIGGVMVKVSIS